MPYFNRFTQADIIFNHINSNISSITGTFIEPAYTGFLSVSAVTVFELAIKDLFIDFATKKNKHFGIFVDNHFFKINGRIKLEFLKDHIKKFDVKYIKRFEKRLILCDKYYQNNFGINIKTKYDNLILCRHEFVHKGNPTLSIIEVIDSYNHCKAIIHCLDSAMIR